MGPTKPPCWHSRFIFIDFISLKKSQIFSPGLFVGYLVKTTGGPPPQKKTVPCLLLDLGLCSFSTC